VRLYSNENFPFLVVAELRRLGHDVTTVLESGKSNRATPDTEILEFAASEKRAVLTLNRKHFIALHASMPGHAGIVGAESTRISSAKHGGSTRHWLVIRTCLAN